MFLNEKIIEAISHFAYLIKKFHLLIVQVKSLGFGFDFFFTLFERLNFVNPLQITHLKIAATLKFVVFSQSVGWVVGWLVS